MVLAGFLVQVARRLLVHLLELLATDRLNLDQLLLKIVIVVLKHLNPGEVGFL